MHLTCPGWNVKGFTLPGAPLVIIGHNDRIAWHLVSTPEPWNVHKSKGTREAAPLDTCCAVQLRKTPLPAR
jgi:hypothetical protein